MEPNSKENGVPLAALNANESMLKPALAPGSIPSSRRASADGTSATKVQPLQGSALRRLPTTCQRQSTLLVSGGSRSNGRWSRLHRRQREQLFPVLVP